MKRSFQWLLVVSVFIFSFNTKLISQNFFEEIDKVHAGLLKYIDSLDLSREKFINGRSGSVEYQLEINRISTEISMLAGRNLELTFPIVDSINSIWLSNPDYIAMDTSGFSEADTVEEFSFPKGHNVAKPNVMSVFMDAVIPSPNKKTYLEGNIRLGFIQSMSPHGTGTFTPSLKAWHNFYFDNFHLALRTRLGHNGSRLFIRYGLGIDYVSISQKMNIQRLITDQVIFPYFDNKVNTDPSIEATKLRLKYLYIPLGLACQFQKKLRIEASAFINILLRERYYTEFSGSERDYETVLHTNLGVRNFYTGINAQFFYKRTGLYFETSFNSIFKRQSLTNINYFKIGVVFR